jgi:hypothetical protein
MKSKENQRAISILTKMDDRNLTKGIKPISVLEIKILDLIESLNNGTYKIDRELCNMTVSLSNKRKWGDSLSKIAKDSDLLKKD